MWKIAIAVMLLAGSAFAGADLTITSPNLKAGTTNELAYDAATRQVSLILNIAPSEGSAVSGVSLYSVGTTPGAVRLVGRTVGTNILDTFLNGNAPGGLIESYNDLGVRSDPATEGVTAPFTLMTMVVGVDPTATGPVTLVLSGSWVDTDFNEGEYAPMTFTLTPEPASMLLLAAGAAFFARRRRA